MTRRDPNTARQLIIKRQLAEAILEAFHSEGCSTTTIAARFALSEAEVCGVLNEMERR
ncbi:hypothetical protein [Rhizobium halophytocola]|uniref:Transposase n=1 Tax=Rhizobium halophytocola TaxID=735519 RepID=A0ABS4DXX0_9HYPH|nr:hypothetical protein [Rhizobium halophytocola]MBP1850532.1 transposase [Rhizobium halophytocola]